MNLCLDQGNTRLKAAWFEEDTLVELKEDISQEVLLTKIQEQMIHHVLLASTKKVSNVFLNQLQKSTKLFQLSPELPIPIHNLYDSPKTLGMDRVAAAVGARSLFPDKACLVIDLGTCITFDVIDAENQFLGGNIAPGLHMRLRAMHDYTDKLPLLQAEEYEQFSGKYFGKSTKEAMLNGVVQGILAEIQSMMLHVRQHYPKFATVLCGGDAIFFDSKLKEQIFVNPNLTLIGLNRILNYNVQKASF